jgi:hypothetical protein
MHSWRHSLISTLGLVVLIAQPSELRAEDSPQRISSVMPEVTTFGMISMVIEGASAGRAPSAFAREPLPSSIWAESIDDATGAPGLRLSSTGLGAAPMGPSAPVRFATVGHGSSDMDLDALDGARGMLPANHHARVAKLTPDHLPADVIQRVVRASFGRFQVCYDDALDREPSLSGRVVVKFVIDRYGQVALARDVASDLPNADVVSCVVRAFDTLTFPESKDSAVTVVYPLMFTP